MNAITFVSLHAKEEKNDDVVFFLYSTSFFTSVNKKTKIIHPFFTILFKITLTDEKNGLEKLPERSVKKGMKISY
jgi:hypothetical protein